ncbi:hypothetical protein N752_08575 [Desulforamulus aquiferis]|nr:hypothetical protein N752_08575 [Desulforamulus aquiferis]
MFNRARQFWNALFSKMGTEELTFVKKHLNAKEQHLFFLPWIGQPKPIV